MIETRLLMGMPITIEIVDQKATQETFNKAFEYLDYVDKNFSTFKDDSEISKINRGEIAKENWSDAMNEVFALAEQTKKETDGFFDIVDNKGTYNPSGIVKGWAIFNTAKLLWEMEMKDFYVNAGGDIQFSGKNADGTLWKTGIKNPFKQEEIVKVVHLRHGAGIATSGNYIRGDHIYNPKKREEIIQDIVSLTVIGPNVLEADRFATAIFAMGKNGVEFLEQLKGFEGYMIDKDGMAYMTSSFESYTNEHT